MVLGSILRFILTRLSRRRLPIIDGTLELSGLMASVEVIRDIWGIPHIYAENDHDLIFVQGFIHAQDRFWQMELNRRLATGRLSEILGEIALDTDRTCRTFGFSRLGLEDWKNMDEELKKMFEAYTAGINAFLQHPESKLPIEFTLLRYKPELWKIEDSLAYGRIMLWKLSQKFYSKLVRKMLIDAVGEEHASELEISYPEINPSTLPKGIEFNILNSDGNLLRANGPFLDQGKGSNSWVVSGRKTANGNAFLCNDMHLEQTLPAIWYENHLISDSLNVSGVTTPGVPFVHVGHNAHISWGMTLTYIDCEDLFLEKINSKNQNQYDFKGEWHDLEIIPEKIYIKGKSEPYVESVKITKHGPIVSDVINYPQIKLSLQSMALRSGNAFKGWYLLNKAQTWDNFVEAIKCINTTHLNVTYADIEGNVGYWASGKVPIRGKGDGRIPVPGWTGEYEWINEVPFEEMPHALNPENGYLVNCNNKIISEDYPHELGFIWMNGYRANRLTEMIESKEKVSLEDFKEMQTDYMSIPGKEFVQLLKNLDPKISDPNSKEILEKLRQWDGNLSPESVGATIYEVIRYFIVRNILESALDKELTTTIMGEAFHPMLYVTHDFYGHDTVVMLRLLNNSESSWWIKQAGGPEGLITKSLKDSYDWLRSNLSKNLSEWKWGSIHRMEFPHAMALQKPLDKVFNRGPLAIGGDTDTLCQTAIAYSDPKNNSFDAKAWVPTHRQIIDMGNLSNSLMVFAPGQSGHLGSHHYDDLIDLWINGEYHPMFWERDQIEANKEGSLTLNPE
ncbi:MAG: penicillin acylase family protein [Candidatus Hodarchaeota archaeon]